MLQKFKEICLTLGVFSLIAAPLALTASVSADNIIAGGVCNGVQASTTSTKTVNLQPQTASGACTNTSASGQGLTDILKLVINVFSIIVGFVAVVMIIYGGIKYITSGGDSGNISGAKNTIVYAIIGLVIVALAQLIVHFVLSKASSVTGAS